MGKRYALFIALSTLILVAYFGARAILLPPPPVKDKGDKQVAQQNDGQNEDAQAQGDKDQGKNNKGDQDKGNPKPPENTGDKTNGQGNESPDGGQQQGEIQPKPPAQKYPQQWTTLGSLDPESPYTALWTFNSRGAAIERCELNSQRYRDLDDKSGYLGELALTDEPTGGCRVNVVGDGTPAALASPDNPSFPPGLSVGDIILAADGTTVSSSANLKNLLAEKQPGDTLTLTVQRGEGVESATVVLTATLRDQPLDLIQPEYDGYIARLKLTDDPSRGCRVETVGDGTPAALALADNPSIGPGLAVGDVIVAADGTTVSTAADLKNVLAEKRLDDTLTLSVQRGEGDASTIIVFTATLRDQLSLLLTLQGRVGQKNVDLKQPLEQNWEMHVVAGNANAVEFRYVADAAALEELDLDGPIEIIKRYHLPESTTGEDPSGEDLRNHLLVEVEIRNLAAEKQTISYRLDGPNGLPLEGWWYLNKVQPHWGAAGARDIVWSSEGRGHQLMPCPTIFRNTLKKSLSKNNLFAPSDEGDDRKLQYIGLETQYFATALIPTDGEAHQEQAFARADGVALSEVDKDNSRSMKRTNVTFHLVSEPAQLDGDDGVLKQSFILFAGPKEPKLLASYGLQDCTYYGWFGFVSRPLTAVLHFFYGIFGNYGIAIVLLTLLVRACLLPVSFKATKNAQMMQTLAPEMKAIAEKYKNDMEKRGKAQRELFQKHNYNPFGGCLLLFLQLPVFLGLYRGLSVDISLRGQPLIPGLSWCSNLAAPDHLFRWFSSPEWAFGESGWLGPFFNILPLVTVALFLLQQKMFMPPATDDQTRMQQRMMNYMTLFMGVLFFKVPSGLCIYFITSSLWGVVERKLLPKVMAARGEKSKAAGKESKEKKSLLSLFKLASNGEAAKRARRRKQRKA